MLASLAVAVLATLSPLQPEQVVVGAAGGKHGGGNHEQVVVGAAGGKHHEEGGKHHEAGSSHEGFEHFGKHLKTKSVSAVIPLLYALRDDTVERILLAPGRYTVGKTLMLKRSVVLEAEVPGTVVLRGNSSCPFGLFEGTQYAHGYNECKQVSERVIDVPPGVQPDLQIELVGLNITGGHAVDGNGGGIRISGGRAKFTNCNIYENAAQVGMHGVPPEDTASGGGGGLAIEGTAAVNLTGCHIHTNNVLGGSGAGVLIRGGKVRFSRCKVALNGNPPHFKVPMLRAGGGLRVEGGDVVVDGCTLNTNHGSGLALSREATVLVNDSKIYDNNATEGAGVHQTSLTSALTVARTKIYRNNATTGGGLSVGNASISDAQVFANSADRGAGVYVKKRATLRLSGSQIYTNKAAKAGGGAFVFLLAKATVINSTFRENAVTAGHANGSGSGAGIYARCSSTVRLTRDKFVSNPPKVGGDDVFVQHMDDASVTDAESKAYCSAKPTMSLRTPTMGLHGPAVSSVCIEEDEDVAGATVIRKSESSANISAGCPLELDEVDDEPSAVGCVTGRHCAPATLATVLIVFLLALLAGLALCGWYYKSRAEAEADEASGKVSRKPEHRCDPGACIFACIGLFVRDDPKKGKK